MEQKAKVLGKPVMEARKLCKTYAGVKVLTDVDYSLFEGEVHALVGENGAGKSTIIKILAGVEKPDEGSEIYFLGEKMQHLSVSKTHSMGISVIYQDISLFPNLSVSENLQIGRTTGVFSNRKQIIAEAKTAFEKFGIAMDLNANLGDLSIGQQQMVAIVRAVTHNARIIVMDEPTASLSSNEVELLYKIIKDLKAINISIIYISHKLDEIFALADRISVLRDGKLVACDIAENFSCERLINLMVGRELRFFPMHSEGELGAIIFEAENLCTESVESVSFTVRKGEILGITGLVGAGRSELAQAVFGLRKIKSGRLFIHGTPVHIHSASQAITNGISYLPEDRHTQGLFKSQNMIKNITSATINDMLGRFLLISQKKELKTTKKYIQALDIRPQNPEILIESMSGGNQQKALIGRWLNTRPKVLIADEPTAGVDVGAKLEIHKLLRKLASEGVAVILISSDLLEVMAVSDNILVMREGRVINLFDARSATQESILACSLA